MCESTILSIVREEREVTTSEYMRFGKEVCEISGRSRVMQELKETLAYPHFDFGNSFCTGFHDFTVLFAFLTVIRVAV